MIVMKQENLANLLGAFATMINDGVLGAMASAPELLREQTALALLAKYPSCSIEQLRDPLGLSHSGCVRLIDRLVAAGSVERHAAEDGRAVALRLTRRGRSTVVSNTEKRADALMQLVGTLSADERGVLAQLVTQLLDRGTATPRAAGKTCRLCDYEACVECPMREKFASSDSL